MTLRVRSMPWVLATAPRRYQRLRALPLAIGHGGRRPGCRPCGPGCRAGVTRGCGQGDAGGDTLGECVPERDAGKRVGVRAGLAQVIHEGVAGLARGEGATAALQAAQGQALGFKGGEGVVGQAADGLDGIVHIDHEDAVVVAVAGAGPGSGSGSGSGSGPSPGSGVGSGSHKTACILPSGSRMCRQRRCRRRRWPWLRYGCLPGHPGRWASWRH